RPRRVGGNDPAARRVRECASLGNQARHHRAGSGARVATLARRRYPSGRALQRRDQRRAAGGRQPVTPPSALPACPVPEPLIVLRAASPESLASRVRDAVAELAAAMATDVRIEPVYVIAPLMMATTSLEDIADELARAAISVDEDAGRAAQRAR